MTKKARAGRTLVLVGADGAGKSSQARRLCAAMSPGAVYMYMGSNPAAATHALWTNRMWNWLRRHLGGATRDSGPPEVSVAPPPSGRIDRGLQHLKSLIALGIRVSEELHRLLLAKVYVRRGFLVIMDRHPYADYYTRHVQAATGWRRLGDRIHGFLLERVYPRPSGVIVLDAPAEVLHARKPEGSLAAIRARRQEYLDMARMATEFPVTIVDADRSEDDVHADLVRIALAGR